jgi:hypothetical protein
MLPLLQYVSKAYIKQFVYVGVYLIIFRTFNSSEQWGFNIICFFIQYIVLISRQFE